MLLQKANNEFDTSEKLDVVSISIRAYEINKF